MPRLTLALRLRLWLLYDVVEPAWLGSDPRTLWGAALSRVHARLMWHGW